MIVALAGRRVDAEDSGDVRFPLINQHRVAVRITRLLERLGATSLVSSAACGADLLALEAAAELGLRRRVVLPHEPGKFRESSVIDRPGHWGAVYDRVIAEVTAAGDLVVMPPAGSGESAYAAANEAILNEALGMSTSAPAGSPTVSQVVAVIVWEGASRGDDDMTEHFAERARSLGLSVEEVLTI